MKEVANDRRVIILQRPRIQTLDGEPATIFVGESPYRSGSAYGPGAYAGYGSMQESQMGATLEVNPRITVEGSLLLGIYQKVETAKGSVSIANVGNVPITSRQEFQAEVNVADRQTILLGGLIHDVKDGSHKRIPLIRRIFRKSGDHPKRIEMMVAIRAIILPSPDQIADGSGVRFNQYPK